MGAARSDNEGARGSAPTVFVSDPTAEAERVAQALRANGYGVVDVPLSMLVARVAVQHPRVILVDADGDDALDIVARMRELPEADDIHVLYLGRPGGAVSTPEEALAHEGSGLFVRPVEVAALVRKVEALTGRSPGGDSPRASPPPPVPSIHRSSNPPSLPPASMRSPMTGPAIPEARASSPALRLSKSPSDPPTLGAPSLVRRGFALTPPMSDELQELLAEAERRVHVHADTDSLVPSPEEEIEAVLPAELLASLDEPLEEDDDEDDAPVGPRGAPGASVPLERTCDGGPSRTTGASTTGGGATPRASVPHRPVTGDESLTPHTGQTGQTGRTRDGADDGTGPGASGAGTSNVGRGETPASSRDAGRSTGVQADAAHRVPMETEPPPPSEAGPALAAGGLQSFPATIGPGEAMRLVARAIGARTTGSVCLASQGVDRRIVLREGDVVTAASTAPDESLLAFLGSRGDLPRETVRRLGSKFPASGRHAGAALVARGYVRQDQMWTTLRAHAEWVLARALQATGARVTVEQQPPGRLAGEPSVFGGSTGAEVFVELVRRILPTAEAIERLGGAGSRIGEGPLRDLLGECALAGDDLAHVRAAPGRTLREIVESAPEGDLATVVFALVELGVLEAARGVGGEALLDDGSAPDVAALDSEAIRERVRARLQLVDDGDYFAVLGVAHEATGYEIRRAFVDLRRAFDPSRLLTPEVADLGEDVRKIVFVLEEAYEILRDAARRERYRRAIETAP